MTLISFLEYPNQLKIVSRLRHPTSTLALRVCLKGTFERLAGVIEEGGIFGGVALVAQGREA